MPHLRVGKALAQALVFASLLSACDDTPSRKLAYVNLNHILTDARLTEQEAARNEKIKETLQTTQEKLDAMCPAAGAARQKCLNNSRNAINRLYNMELGRTRQQSLKFIAAAVEVVRSKAHLSLVLNGQSVVAGNPVMDISDVVIRQLRGASMDYGKLPEFTIRSNAAPEDAPIKTDGAWK